MSKPLDCRAAAARCLAAINQGASLSQQLPIYEQKVVERDRGLLRQLCYGTLRFQPRLVAVARQLLKKPFKEKDEDLHMLILLGIYQLSEMRIPDHAAVSATVAATKPLKKDWARGLINGVLRQWQRREQSLLAELNPAQLGSHPGWLYKALHRAWPEQAENIVEANNQHPPMCLRVNPLQQSAEAYLQQLDELGIASQACEFAPLGLRLQQPVAVEQLPGFFEGCASVQDEAPQLCGQLLDLQPGQRVLDSCAAPGGKTCQLLELEPELAEVVALDIDIQRLQRVEENLERLQLQAAVICGDASERDWWDGQTFDRILLDAPCSATGVIRRNPDIKLHRRPEDIVELAALQRRILDNQWALLKPGGLLLYATCSVLPAENSELVAAFCQQQQDAEHLAIDATWGIAQHYGRQLLPTADGADGFFYALLKKKLS